MKFEECVEEGSVVKISKDMRRSRSLLRIAEDRLKYLDKEKITKLNSNFILEQYYSAFIEIIHSLALKRGYKILNHLCLKSFIEEVLSKPKIAEKFDKFRKIRNNLVYYGIKVDSTVAKKRINEIKDLINSIRKL